MPQQVSGKPSRPQLSKTYSGDAVTIEQLDECIKIVAGWMIKHNMPECIHALNRLTAERERLIQEGDALEHARRVLAEYESHEEG